MKNRQEFQDKIRFQVNKYIFDRGYAPEVSDLSELLQASQPEIRKALDDLAADHAIVLHPGTHRIWVAHPFALFPTLFWVVSGTKSWWGNCTWCSLGIAAIAEQDAAIHTKIRGEAEPLVINVKQGEVQEKNLLVHFPVPARRFWNNVIYTCANMLAFQSMEEIDSWCLRHRVSKGEVLPVTQVWDLARVWYGNYLDPRWTRKTIEEAEAKFRQVGLTSAFWQLST